MKNWLTKRITIEELEAAMKLISSQKRIQEFLVLLHSTT